MQAITETSYYHTPNYLSYTLSMFYFPILYTLFIIYNHPYIENIPYLSIFIYIS